MSARAVVDLIRQMLAAGATTDAALIAAEALASFEERDAKRREAAAARKQRQRNRERDSHATITGQSRDNHGTVAAQSRDPLTPLCPPPPPPLNTPQTPDEDVAARGREFSIDDGDRLFARLSECVIPADHALLADPLGPSVCAGWLASGYDETRDIGPALRKALTTGRFKIRRMDAMTKWVTAHHSERIAAEAVQPAIDTMNPAPPLKRRTHNEPGFVHVGGDMLVGDFAALDRR